MDINTEIHPDDLVIEDLPITLELQVPDADTDTVNIVKAGTNIIKSLVLNSPPESLYGRIAVGMDIISTTKTTAVVRFSIEDTTLNKRK